MINQSQPIVLADGTMTPLFRDFINQLSRAIPITGSGSPEGVVSAAQGQVYFDTTGNVVYNKVQPAIAGDSTMGWV